MLNRQLIRSFENLVEHGSFTRAAIALDMTQAAVSQHIARLEAELGQLVVRRPRAVELTPTGKALLAYARELEQADRRLNSRLSETAELRGEVSLITPGSVGLRIYPVLLDLQMREPDLAMRHRFAPDSEVIDAILDTRFEIGLATTPADDPRISASPFLEEPLELIVPADAEVFGWEDLQRLGFIDHPDGQAMARRLLGLRYPRNPGFASLPIRGFTNQIALILEPVARGLGFTVLPRYALEAFQRPAEIRTIETSVPVHDTLWLLHRSEWPLTARAQHVVAYMREALNRIKIEG